MGDFTDKLALGTSRMNPSSMVPGAMGGNAPQNGMRTQGSTNAFSGQPIGPQREVYKNFGVTPMNFTDPNAQIANQATGRDYNLRNAQEAALLQQLAAPGRTQQNRAAHSIAMPLQQKTQSDLPVEKQQMLPNKNEKKPSGYKREDFGMLADVFKALSER